MKFSILFFLIFLNITFLSAQTFELFMDSVQIKSGDTIQLFADSNNYISKYFQIKNKSDRVQEIRMIKDENKLLAGTTSSFCCGGICWFGKMSSCYSIGTSSPDSSFGIYYSSFDVRGVSHVSYAISNCNEDDSLVFHVLFTDDTPATILSENTSQLHVYYDNMLQHIILEKNGLGGGLLKVYTLNGKCITSQNFNNEEKQVVNMKPFGKGFYIVVINGRKNSVAYKMMITN